MSTRILLIDDHPVIRKGLALALDEEPDLEVVAQATDAETALANFAEIDPDFVIVDVSLPGISGIEFLKQLAVFAPDIPALVVSRHDEALYAERAVRAGARGYVSKLQAVDTIVQAVHTVLDGGIYLSEPFKDKLLFGDIAGSPALSSPLDALSDRELEVFEMTGRGLPTREIAERLHLSMKTIESYRTRIKDKLGYESGNEVIRQAIRWVEGESAT